jgi:hypothetical protein
MTTLTGPVAGRAITGYRHEIDHGFCTICGSVWPCSRAEPEWLPPAVPTPRFAATRSEA